MEIPTAGPIRQLLAKFGKVVFDQDFVVGGETKTYMLYTVKAGTEPAMIVAVTDAGEIELCKPTHEPSACRCIRSGPIGFDEPVPPVPAGPCGPAGESQ